METFVEVFFSSSFFGFLCVPLRERREAQTQSNRTGLFRGSQTTGPGQPRRRLTQNMREWGACRLFGVSPSMASLFHGACPLCLFHPTHRAVIINASRVFIWTRTTYLVLLWHEYESRQQKTSGPVKRRQDAMRWHQPSVISATPVIPKKNDTGRREACMVNHNRNGKEWKQLLRKSTVE